MARVGRGPRAFVLHELKRHDEALVSYDRALAMQPNFAAACSNQGHTLQELRRFEEAEASYEKALALRPDLANAQFGLALCHLLTGDFVRGWRRFEWRWETADLSPTKRHFVQTPWRGAKDIAGKTMLLHSEQGFGDTLQFCRYVPLVAELGAPTSSKCRRLYVR